MHNLLGMRVVTFANIIKSMGSSLYRYAIIDLVTVSIKNHLQKEMNH